MLKRFLLITTLFLFTGFLEAHDLYLHPSSFYSEKPEPIELKMSVTDTRFPGTPTGWRSDKTVQFKIIGPSGLRDLDNPSQGNPEIELDKNGTHIIGWESSATYISINPVIFTKYITLEGYQNAIKAREKNSTTKNAFGRERYSRFVKTFVQLGADKSDDFKKSMGFKIEIIPKSNPASLKVGDELEVQLLFDGKPLAGNRIMATYDEYSTKQEDYAQTVQTDKNGAARFKITNPGLWLVRSNRMLPVESDPKAEWESFWSNITFQVR